MGLLAVNLSLPADQFSTTPCSIFNPPVFEWDVNAVISNYEIQFSLDPAFASPPLKIKTSGLAYGMTLSQWKKVLSMPGANGGTVYWRVVGIKADGSSVPSESRSILIAAPLPVGAPAISPVSKSKLPLLTWQNGCNVKFKVWFGSDAGFSRKVSLSFQVSDPSLNGGLFSKGLSSGQWLGIRRLVGDQTGSAVYWYVESRDELNRQAVTGVASFFLTD